MIISDMFGELTIDESNFSTTKLREDYNTLILQNPNGKEISLQSLEENLKRISGINRVTSLHVEPTSMINDLRFIRVIPNLVNLHLYGYHLENLDGIEFFKNGRFIEIDTGKNRLRRIDRIGEAPITKLLLRWAGQADIEAISHSSTLQCLEMNACREFAIELLSKVPLEELTLERASIKEFYGSHSIKTLDDIILRDCRELRRLTGDNGGVSRLIVEACNQLDFKTITSFNNLKYLRVISIKKEVLLSWFSGLANLKELSFQNVTMVPDIEDFRTIFPYLQELQVSRLKKAQIAKLSQNSKDVVITNGIISYKNGVPSDFD